MDWSAATASARRASLQTFGVPVTYQPKDGTPTTTTPAGEELVGVFRSGTVELPTDTGATVLVNRSTVFLDVEDLGGLVPDREDFLTVRGEQWIVKECHEDGEGGVLLEIGRIE